MDIDPTQPHFNDGHPIPSEKVGRPLQGEKMSLEEKALTKSSPKSSRRLRYEAEVETIKQRHGGLENIRESLGLSRKEITKWLLVDPSAWTRWTQRGESAPPHVYKTLALLLEAGKGLQVGTQEGHGWTRDLRALEDKWETRTKQELDSLETELRGQHSLFSGQHQRQLEEIEMDFRDRFRVQGELFRVELEKQQELGFGWKLLVLVSITLCIYNFVL